jgi:hypothetical protein
MNGRIRSTQVYIEPTEESGYTCEYELDKDKRIVEVQVLNIFLMDSGFNATFSGIAGPYMAPAFWYDQRGIFADTDLPSVGTIPQTIGSSVSADSAGTSTGAVIAQSVAPLVLSGQDLGRVESLRFQYMFNTSDKKAALDATKPRIALLISYID